MLTSRNNDLRWILATIVKSGNRRFWGWHELCFVTFFWLLFFLRTWNQTFFFSLLGRKILQCSPYWRRTYLHFSFDLTVVASLGPFALLSPQQVYLHVAWTLLLLQMGNGGAFFRIQIRCGVKKFGLQKSPGPRNDVWVREMVLTRTHAMSACA